MRIEEATPSTVTELWSSIEPTVHQAKTLEETAQALAAQRGLLQRWIRPERCRAVPAAGRAVQGKDRFARERREDLCRGPGERQALRR